MFPDRPLESTGEDEEPAEEDRREATSDLQEYFEERYRRYEAVGFWRHSPDAAPCG